MINPLFRVYEGMTVLDRAGEEIGTVEMVKMAGTQFEQVPGNEPLSTENGNICAVFSEDGVTEEQAELLIQHGFIRISAQSIIAASRYVRADQIAGVTHDHVILLHRKGTLITPSRAQLADPQESESPTDRSLLATRSLESAWLRPMQVAAE